jgi:hypothetical protein
MHRATMQNDLAFDSALEKTVALRPDEAAE